MHTIEPAQAQNILKELIKDKNHKDPTIEKETIILTSEFKSAFENS